MDEFPQRDPPAASDDPEHHLDADERGEVVAANVVAESSRTSYGSAEGMDMAVVSTVAEHAEADPTELEPLYTIVDPDALERLFQQDVDARVAFPYHGYEVVVHSSGTIEIIDDDDGP